MPNPDDPPALQLAELIATLERLAGELRRDAADHQRKAGQAPDELTRRLALAVATRARLDADLITAALEPYR